LSITSNLRWSSDIEAFNETLVPGDENLKALSSISSKILWKLSEEILQLTPEASALKTRSSLRLYLSATVPAKS
jgi:hypothetical protein